LSSPTKELTIEVFHALVSWSISFEMYASSCSPCIGKTQCAICWGTQWSIHILICRPLPTHHFSPFERRSRADQILLHMYDGRWPNGATRIKSEGKYLAFKIIAHKDSGFFKILQNCLASSTLLKLSKSRKPMPPWCFDQPILSHFT
jgi:hypothetical protein